MLKRNDRKEQVGVVIANKMDKTVVVSVAVKMRHPKYGKVYQRERKFYAHDDSDALQVGQKVKMMETKPLSKLKRWRIVEVMA